MSKKIKKPNSSRSNSAAVEYYILYLNWQLNEPPRINYVSAFSIEEAIELFNKSNPGEQIISAGRV